MRVLTGSGLETSQQKGENVCTFGEGITIPRESAQRRSCCNGVYSVGEHARQSWIESSSGGRARALDPCCLEMGLDHIINGGGIGISMEGVVPAELAKQLGAEL